MITTRHRPDVRYEQSKSGWWLIKEDNVVSQAMFPDRVSAEIAYKNFASPPDEKKRIQK